MKVIQSLHLRLRTFVSGVLIVISFPHWDQSYFIWIALIPWLFELKRVASARQAIVQGLWLSLFMTIGGYYWTAYAMNHFGNIPWSLAYLGVLFFGTFNQFQFVVFAPIYWKIIQKVDFQSSPLIISKHLFGISFIYCGIDWVIPKLFMDTFGHSLYVNPYLRQAADIGGAWFLTLFIFLFNLGLTQALEVAHQYTSKDERIQNWKRIAVPLFLPVICFTFLYLYGSYQHGKMTELMQNPIKTIRFSSIQANIGDFDKVAAETGHLHAADTIVNKYLSLSKTALKNNPRPDFIIWPETAYPGLFRKPREPYELRREKEITEFVRSNNIYMLIGAYDKIGKKDYNTLYFISPKPVKNPKNSPNHNDLQIYHKAILLLFGEYIPGADTFDFIKNLFPQIGFFGRGPGAEVFELETNRTGPFKLSPIICYEALFPAFVIDGANLGSQLIFNITNDSWFGNYGEPYLHMSLTTFRGIETRLPQVRTTNTGISVYVDATGEIVRRTQIATVSILNSDVPITERRVTLMLLWGDWFGKFALAMAALFLVLYWRFTISGAVTSKH